VSGFWAILVLCVAGGLLLFALAWLVAVIAAKQAVEVLERRLKPAVEARFAGWELLKEAYEANFFGLESRGLAQLRGNGALVLARDELFFLQAVNRRELVIPLEDIITLSIVRSHLKKWVGRPLLRVDFRSGEGTDAVAWLVNDPTGWLEAVEAARPGRVS
jgi:hypothetical protein